MSTIVFVLIYLLLFLKESSCMYPLVFGYGYTEMDAMDYNEAAGIIAIAGGSAYYHPTN